jgi:hypothetical protein
LALKELVEEDEDEEDEETLRLQLQAIEARLKLKRLQKTKTNDIAKASDTKKVLRRRVGHIKVVLALKDSVLKAQILEKMCTSLYHQLVGYNQ